MTSISLAEYIDATSFDGQQSGKELDQNINPSHFAVGSLYMTYWNIHGIYSVYKHLAHAPYDMNMSIKF